jgi:hypothetical protein
LNVIKVLSISLLIVAMTASAEAVVVVDSNNLARVEITSAASPSPATGFLTYSFTVSPLLATTEISSIDASFTGADFRQVNPMVGMTSFPTIFSDNNALFPLAGEDAAGQGDTQFEFLRATVTLVPNSAAETSTTLAAAFTGFTPITSNRTIAHVVLPSHERGLLNLHLAVRPQGGGIAQLASFSNVPFGAVAVPEASSAALGAVVVVAFGGAYVRQRRRRQS